MCLLSGIHRRYRMVSPRAWRSLISVWPCASENSVSTLREADVLANPYRCTTPGCRWPWYRTGMCCTPSRNSAPPYPHLVLCVRFTDEI